MRRSVIMQVLGTYHHNFVTHLLEAELQRQVYALAESGQSITAAVLNERKGAILQSFWGDTVDIDDGARMTWMRQPHYYMGLYPYTYSVGLVASTAMSLRVQQEGPPAVQRWLQVLKAGGQIPLDLAVPVAFQFGVQQGQSHGRRLIVVQQAGCGGCWPGIPQGRVWHLCVWAVVRQKIPAERLKPVRRIPLEFLDLSQQPALKGRQIAHEAVVPVPHNQPGYDLGHAVAPGHHADLTLDPVLRYATLTQRVTGDHPHHLAAGVGQRIHLGQSGLDLTVWRL
jgi:hypothetical protein